MKRITLLFAVIAGLGFTSCTKTENPKYVADKFLTAFNERKFDEARKYSTPETTKLVDLMESLTNMAGNNDSIRVGKVEILDERISADTAWVSFKEEGASETQELKLTRVKGKWLVHVTKQDIAAKDLTDNNSMEEEGLWGDDDSLGVDSDTLAAQQLR